MKKINSNNTDKTTTESTGGEQSSTLGQHGDDGDENTEKTHGTHDSITGGAGGGATKSSLLQRAQLYHPLITHKQTTRYTAAILAALVIVLLGFAGGVTFLVRGMNKAQESSADDFEIRAMELVQHIETTWRSYETVALQLHNMCRRSRNITRQEFRDLYLYWIASGINFESCQCSPNVSHAERELYENEARNYYAEYYPSLDYQGIVGFVPSNGTYDAEGEIIRNDLVVVPSPPRPFYWVVHYLEPVLPNAPAVELDMYSNPSQKNEIDMAVATRQPVLSKRLNLVQETEGEDVYSVIIYHPGIHLDDPDVWTEDDKPKEVSLIVVRMPAFLERVADTQHEQLAVYLYDTTVMNTGGTPEFLGAGAIRGLEGLELEKELDYDSFRQHVSSSQRQQELYYEEEISITPSGTWRICVVPVDDAYEANYSSVILAGTLIAGGGLFIAAWYLSTLRRNLRMNELRLASEAQRAALVVKNAEEAAEAERELNDFLAHEVRNPLSAAISACSFVSSAVQGGREGKSIVSKVSSLPEGGDVSTVQDDLNVINSSLLYINDLLRNILDSHKAIKGQLQIEMRTACLRKDIFDPVASMIYNKRENHFNVEIDCAESLITVTDPLRLKQVVLNLANNSCKFVQKGFIRIGAIVDSDDKVSVFVEDSGPGVDPDKRSHLFEKFQTSLDELAQGTGVGLSLCKELTRLMGAEIELDETYMSGIEGCPGSRFVVHLNQKVQQPKENAQKLFRDNSNTESDLPNLPLAQRVVFVDDDPILRRLFIRSVRRVAPTWTVEEATSGETCIRFVEEDIDRYDIIFMDHYMPGVHKPMLGTEAVRTLRSIGYKGIICGLSANDLCAQFLDAGANYFLFKPFPCEKAVLHRELWRMVFNEQDMA